MNRIREYFTDHYEGQGRLFGWICIIIILVLSLTFFKTGGPGRVDPDATPSWSHGHASSD